MGFTDIINSINDVVWSYVMVAILLGCALWFSFRTKFVQVRMLGEMFRLLGRSASKNPELTTEDIEIPAKKRRHMNSFQAFTLSMSSRIGVGNLAGVATAIGIGGPGAIFWMWLSAIFSAATAFVECTLAQLYKEKHQQSFLGGPAYYISKGLGCKWLSYVFAILMILTFTMTYNSLESNTFTEAFNAAFGWDRLLLGIILTVLVTVVAFGGAHFIARVCQYIVPFMAIFYIGLAIIITLVNITHLPAMFALIFEDAFGIRQVVGGGIGATIMMGIKRGIYSNEAGEGSSPIAAATASISHPVKQGLIQCLGVFTDTLVVCSCTAFIILLAGEGVYAGDADGIVITQNALTYHVGVLGKPCLAIALFFFVFTSLIGSYFYGETNVRYLTKNPKAIIVLRILVAGMILAGSVLSLETVWAVIDLCMAFLVLANLTAVVPLSGQAIKLLEDYRKQKRAGIESPHFKKSDIPDLKGEIEWWN